MDNKNVAYTNGGVTPIGAIFNVYAGKFENFVADYLVSQGIDGVIETKLHVRDMGTSRANPIIYAFLKRDNNIVTGGKGNIPQYLRDKIDNSRTRVNENGMKKLSGLVNPKHINSGATPDGDVYVEIDLFRALGLYLAATYREHKLTVYEINVVNDEIVLTVIKQEVPKASYGSGKSDKRAAFMDRNSSRRY